MTGPIPAAVFLLLGACSGSVDAQALGTAFTYQGQLKDGGNPASGLFDLQICLFDSPVNPIPLSCAPDFNDVPVEEGLFAVNLDFGAAPFAGQQRFLEFRVRPGASGAGYTILAPRQVIRPTPEALRSAVTAAAPWSGLSGIPPGFADGVDNDAGGTVTNIATGAGLTGGPITGAGTVAVAPGGIGGALINPAEVQARVSGTCGPGQFVRSVNQDGTLVCDAAGIGSITGVTAGTGLEGGGTTGTVTLGIAQGGVGAAQINTGQVQARVAGDCVVGQYIRAVLADGSVVCGTDANSGGSVTSISTGAGLAGGPITTSGVVSVAPGGIGATEINPAQVQVRVSGTCPLGQYLRGVNVNGSVICQSLPIADTTQISTVDIQAGPVGYHTSLAIGVDGLPVISHGGNGNLRVAKCTKSDCSGASVISDLGDVGSSLISTSIAIGTDGFPVISHRFENPLNRLRIAKCHDAACVGPATKTFIDPANNTGEWSSIKIGLDGNPVVSYVDSTLGALKVAKCANTACSGSATISVVDDPANQVGQFSSLALAPDGFPIISYFDSTANALKVAKCVDPACLGPAAITTVDDPANQVGGFSSIAIGADGLPVISYHDFTAAALKVAKCVNVACTGSSTISVVADNDQNLGTWTSIAIGADGMPIIAFKSDSAGLLIAKCANASCTGAATIRQVDNLYSAGTYASLAIGTDGLPVISYQRNGGTPFLAVAKCITDDCQ